MAEKACGFGEPKPEDGTAAHADAAHTLLNAWVTKTPITGAFSSYNPSCYYFLGVLYLENMYVGCTQLYGLCAACRPDVHGPPFAVIL